MTDKRWQCQGCDYKTDDYDRAVEHKHATDHIIRDTRRARGGDTADLDPRV